jgi:hypothetical protein
VHGSLCSELTPPLAGFLQSHRGRVSDSKSVNYQLPMQAWAMGSLEPWLHTIPDHAEETDAKLTKCGTARSCIGPSLSTGQRELFAMVSTPGSSSLVFVWMQTAYLLRLNLYKHIHKFQSFLLISKFIHLHTCLAVLGTGPKALHTLCKYTTM